MTEEHALRELDLQFPEEREKLADFLNAHGLRMEDDIEYALVVADGEDTLLGCGCAAGNILKCFAVAPELRGGNLLGTLVGALVKRCMTCGFDELVLVTKPENETVFSSCGFYPVVSTTEAVLMENRADGVQRYLSGLPLPPAGAGEAGAIVMNANPMTRGHLHLIQYAAERCNSLYVFVVEEDRSLFSFSDRIALVRAATETMPNVTVWPSGPYIISNRTFPAYFLKQEEAGRVQAELDAKLFAERIAPRLGIRHRFVGQEPTDPTTRQYNAALAKLCAEGGVEICEIPRYEVDGQAVSASAVREELRRCGGATEALREMVPEATFTYLRERFGEAMHEA